MPSVDLGLYFPGWRTGTRYTFTRLRIPVPWVFVLTYLIGVGLEHVWPLHAGTGVGASVTLDVGAVVFTVGAVIAVAGLCLLVPLGTYLGAGLVGLTLVACGLTLVAASPWMPRRTQSGIEALRWAHGFELYMQTAERDRQLFAERDSDRFLDNLPYAVVLGCAERWVARLHALDSPGLAYLSFTAAALRQALPRLARFKTTQAAVQFLNAGFAGAQKGARDLDGSLAELKRLGYTKGS